ncbi:hypothetical protein BSKO_08603 [Bryopsis sp. KO-2023]|nr:hypothetical protein BSKO_08603 [Bryopsis sp. KO-2023]
MAEALLQALNALYHHPDSQVKESADKWLERWRESTEAWQISDSLLHSPNTDKQTRLFCAQTLKTKVQQDFEELPVGSHSSLRQSLLALLLKYAVGFPTVRTQLCLALAAFTAHAPASQWENVGAVQWFANKLGRESKDVAVPCMLEMLAVLPEEAESRRVCVGPTRRDELRRELRQSLPNVLQILTGCLTGPSVVGQALRSFSSWLRLCDREANLTDLNLHQHVVVAAAIEALKGTEHFADAVDVICELLWLTSSTQYRPNPQLMPLVNLLVPTILGQTSRFYLILQRAQAAANGEDPDQIQPGVFPDDDDEIEKSSARLFTELGICYANLIAEGSELEELVGIILAVTRHPDENISSMGLDFWHRLAHRLTTSFDLSPEGPEAAAPEIRKDRFLPVFEQLVGVLEAQVRYPQNYAQMREDEKSDLMNKRDSIRTALMDPSLVLGGKRIMELLLHSINTACRAPAEKGVELEWARVEALLFCLRAVSSTSEAARDAHHSRLYKTLTDLPDHQLIQRTACLCIAAYSDWLGRDLRKGNADGVRAVLQMLTRNMGSFETSGAAAKGFLEVCESCAPCMESFVDGLVEIYRRVVIATDAHKGLGTLQPGSPQVTEQDAMLVMEGVCRAASTSMPDDRKAGPLSKLVDLTIASLEQMIQASKGGMEINKERIAVLVDRLSVVFRCYHSTEGMAELTGRVWLLLDFVLEQLPADTHTIERICRCIKSGLKASSTSCSPLLTAMVQTLPRRFAATQHSAFLYVASELAKIFGRDASKTDVLRSMMTDLFTKACSRLRRLEDFNQNPCIADDTFLLAKRVLQYCPVVLIGVAQMVELLLDTACAGILVQHREACCSILSFLSRLLHPARPEELGISNNVMDQVRRAFGARAPLLMRLLVAGIVGTLPSFLLEDVSDALHCILSDTQPQGVQWLSEAVSMLPETSATSPEREKFLGAAMAANHEVSSRALEDAVFDLSDICRRSRSVRVAAQQAVLPKELHQAVY